MFVPGKKEGKRGGASRITIQRELGLTKGNTFDSSAVIRNTSRGGRLGISENVAEGGGVH